MFRKIALDFLVCDFDVCIGPRSWDGFNPFICEIWMAIRHAERQRSLRFLRIVLKWAWPLKAFVKHVSRPNFISSFSNRESLFTLQIKRAIRSVGIRGRSSHILFAQIHLGAISKSCGPFGLDIGKLIELIRRRSANL